MIGDDQLKENMLCPYLPGPFFFFSFHELFLLVGGQEKQTVEN